MSSISSGRQNHAQMQIAPRAGTRDRKLGLFATVGLWLWVCLLLFGPPGVYNSFSIKIGSGSVSVQDITLGLLAIVSFWLVEVADGAHKGPVRTYFRFIVAVSLYCTLLGSLSLPGQSMITEWKRIIGLFAGVSLGILLHKGKYRAESVVLSFDFLVICVALIASVRGMGQQTIQAGADVEAQRVGGLGLVLANTIWPIWLPVLLCRLITARQMKYKALLACLLPALVLIVVAFGARSVALSVFASILASFAWVLLTRLRLHTRALTTTPSSHHTIAKNGLGVILILLSALLITFSGVSSGRARSTLRSFCSQIHWW